MLLQDDRGVAAFAAEYRFDLWHSILGNWHPETTCMSVRERRMSPVHAVNGNGDPVEGRIGERCRLTAAEPSFRQIPRRMAVLSAFGRWESGRSVVPSKGEFS